MSTPLIKLRTVLTVTNLKLRSSDRKIEVTAENFHSGSKHTRTFTCDPVLTPHIGDTVEENTCWTWELKEEENNEA